MPRPKVIEHEGKKLHRLPERRRRPYVSAFGPTPFRARRLRHAGNATSGGGAVGREARHAGGQHVVSVAEVERHEVREGIVQGIAGHAAGNPRLRSVGQLPGGHGRAGGRTCRGLLRPTGAGRSDDGGGDPGGHERLQRRADATGRCAAGRSVATTCRVRNGNG